MGVTTKDLAKICGVSRTTITRALHGTGSIKPETKQMILETAEKMTQVCQFSARTRTNTDNRTSVLSVQKTISIQLAVLSPVSSDTCLLASVNLSLTSLKQC